MKVRSVVIALVLRVVPVMAVGCDDLKDFRGVHSGRIIGGEFVRSCFPAQTMLTLQFDPAHAVALEPGEEPPAGPPNTITTDDGTFTDTRLEPLRNLPHDPLSELDFPGPQRLRSYLLLARPESGPLAGRDATVVVSLLASEKVEVRIIARSADGVAGCLADLEATDAGTPAPTSERREYFGLWRMR